MWKYYSIEGISLLLAVFILYLNLTKKLSSFKKRPSLQMVFCFVPVYEIGGEASSRIHPPLTRGMVRSLAKQVLVNVDALRSFGSYYNIY